MSNPDLEVYKRQGFGRLLGPGARPGLVTVDFVNAFADPGQFGGGNIGPAIDATAKLLHFAREKKWPIAHTRVIYADDGSDAGAFTDRNAGLLGLTEDNPASQVVSQLAPRIDELIIRKRQPSAFFGTEYAAWLHRKGVDTLIVTGCTTSGCVRATVVDAMSSNFRVLVPVDCVGDRAIGPHEANLFDIGQKYADLMTSAEVMEAYTSHSSKNAALSVSGR